MRLLAIVLSLSLLPLAAFAADEAAQTGLPVPRFVSLKSDETNIRTGPGTRYPIQWVYRREDMPVEIIEEFEHWRKIRDIEGTMGWVHKSMLSGTRHVLIKGKDSQVVRAEPSEKGRPLLKAEPKVLAHLISCEPVWCRIQVSGRKGWIEKKHLFGVYTDEIVD